VRRAALIGLLAAVYFASAKLSLLVAIPPGYATAIWPPSGIALAALLLGGPALWPGIWLGSFAANASIDGALITSAVIATGSTLQGCVVAWLVRARIGVPRRFERARDVLVFVGLAVAGAVIAPTVALLPLSLNAASPAGDLLANWWTWWQGDATGMLIFTPLLLSWTTPGIAWSTRRAAEAALFGALLLACAHLVFSTGVGRSFVVVPFVVWAAFRFGQREVTTASAVVCAMALWYTLRGESGPFGSLRPDEALLLLLAFVATIVVTGLMLCAVLAQLEDARHALERRARQSEERFRLMIESVVDYAILMLDAEGRVASWNAGAERILGYCAAEVIGQRLQRFYLPQDVAAGKPQEELARAAAGHYEAEGWRVRKDGSTFWARAVVTAVRGEDGRLLGYAKVVHDLTERKSAEAALVQAKVTAERASEAKSQFLANMSHELRTPLNSLLILAKLLADNMTGNLSEKQVRFAQTIHASGLDLLGLINDLLDLAKIEAGAVTALNPASTPLADVAHELERMFRPLAQEKGLQFSIELAPGLPTAIRTDGTRLKQVLKNLLANAFKFTRAGAVRLRLAPRGERSVSFEVSDTGIGIAPENQQLIFEPFRQAEASTSRRFGGTGLGLSISRELTHLLGGELSVASEPGSGSTFTLVLPVADERATATV
jgi:PAS domain S-box-containing protein